MSEVINLTQIKTADLLEIFLRKSDNFPRIKETLTRMGSTIGNKNCLIQECYLLHTKGKYYIAHYKELYALEKKCDDMTMSEVVKRNTIAFLLEQWDLCTILTPETAETPPPNLNSIKIITNKNKEFYELITKYNI